MKNRWPLYDLLFLFTRGLQMLRSSSDQIKKQFWLFSVFISLTKWVDGPDWPYKWGCLIRQENGKIWLAEKNGRPWLVRQKRLQVSWVKAAVWLPKKGGSWLAGKKEQYNWPDTRSNLIGWINGNPDWWGKEVTDWPDKWRALVGRINKGSCLADKGGIWLVIFQHRMTEEWMHVGSIKFDTWLNKLLFI